MTPSGARVWIMSAKASVKRAFFFSCGLAVATFGNLYGNSLSKERLLSKSLDTSGLVGKPVTDGSWEPVARIDQVMIDPEDGRITFVVLSFVNRNLSVAVPWSAITVRDRGRIHLEMSEEELENQPRLYRVGGETPGAGEERNAPSFDRAPDRAALEGPAPERFGSSMVSFSPTQLDTGSFSPDQVGWLRGTVVGVISGPFHGESQRVILLVDSGSRTLRVDLAPESYLELTGVQIRPGDRIEIKGADVAREGPPILLATEITTGGRTLRLRDESGNPLWSGNGGRPNRD